MKADYIVTVEWFPVPDCCLDKLEAAIGDPALDDDERIRLVQECRKFTLVYQRGSDHTLYSKNTVIRKRGDTSLSTLD